VQRPNARLTPVLLDCLGMRRMRSLDSLRRNQIACPPLGGYDDLPVEPDESSFALSR
jgi:hypothetical protein